MLKYPSDFQNMVAVDNEDSSWPFSMGALGGGRAE